MKDFEFRNDLREIIGGVTSFSCFEVSVLVIRCEDEGLYKNKCM